jgi:hypothetical protein
MNNLKEKVDFAWREHNKNQMHCDIMASYNIRYKEFR